MAQVRKYQSGGGLYINGKQYTAEQINEYLNQGGFDSQERAALAGTVNAIASGARRDLDRNANSISGEGVQSDFTDFYGGNEKRAARNRTGRNTRWQNRQATWNTDHNTVNSSISKLGGIEEYFNNKVVKKETPKTALGRGEGWFTFGEDGNYTLGPTNASNEKIIRDAFAWLAGNENYRKGWTTEGYGEGLNGLTNWYNGQNVEELIDRIKNKTLTAEDYDVLSKLGFVKSDSQFQKEKSDASLSGLKSQFQNAGYDFDTWSPYFEFDKDGNMVARTINGQSVFAPLGGNGNYWFNDNFSSSNPNYDFLKGHFLIGNRLYKESDANVEGSDLYNYLRRSGGFYDLNNVGRYNEADALISYMWGNNAYVRPDTTDNLAGEFYGSGIRMDNTNYRTAETELPGYTFQDGDQIVRYVDLNTASDPFGLRKDMYAVVDRYGNYRTNSSGAKYKGLDYDDFTNLFAAGPLSTEEEIEQQILERTARISSDKNNPYYNRYSASENPYYDLYIDPSTGDAVMNPKDELSNKWLSGNNKGIKVTPEIAEILQKPEFINALQTDPDFAKKFRNTIQSLTGTDWQDLFKRNLDSIDEFPGIDKKDAQKIIDFFYTQGSNNSGKSKAYSRRNADYIVDLPKLNKFGGKLPKFQSGGAINAGQKQVERKPLVKQPVKSHTEQSRIGIDKLSAAEKAELFSIGADVLGTISGLFGPVGDVAGSGLGFLASTTQLGADISRAGRLTGKDAGRFLMNAGLDAVGLLPFIGDSARVAKTVKNIRKASNILMPIFSTAGLTAAAGSIGKIMNGESLTVDDWGNLAAGFQAVTGIGSAGKQRLGKARVASEMSKLPGTTQKATYSYKPVGGEEIVLDDTQVKAILGGKKDAKKYLTELLKAKGVEESAIPEDIVKKFGFEETGVGRFGSVKEKELPKEVSDRSAFRFFITPGLNKYIEGNTGRLGSVINNHYNTRLETFNPISGIEVTKKTMVPDKKLSRILAQIVREYGLESKFPVTQLEQRVIDRKNWRRLANIPEEEKAFIQYAGPRPSNVKIEEEAADRIANLPVRTIPKFIPWQHRVHWYKPSGIIVDRISLSPHPLTYNPKRALLEVPEPTAVPYTTPKERVRRTRNKYNEKKSVENKIISNLMSKGYSISIPETAGNRRFVPEIIPNKFDDVAQSWRNEFDIRSGSTETASEANTMGLFMRLKSYRQAFNNVNSEKSFRKLIANMANDVEFRLAMEENPGILREEMLAAAIRSGIIGKNRKALLSESGLVFKKGGKILKGQYGLTDFIKSSGLRLDLTNLGNQTVPQTENPVWTPFSGTTTGIVREAINDYQTDLHIQRMQARDALKTPVMTSFSEGYTAGVKERNNAIKDYFDKSRIAFNFGRATQTTNPDKETIGNPEGNAKSTGLDMLPGLGNIAAKYAIGKRASDGQMDLARDVYNTTMSSMPSNVTEYYNRFQDLGIQKTYNDVATSVLNSANKTVYSDAALNEAIRKQAVDKATQLQLEGGMKTSQVYNDWNNQQNELRRNYAAQRTNVENQRRQMSAQAKAYLNQQEGAAIAQNAGLLQGAMKDLGTLMSIPANAKYQQEYTDIMRRYNDLETGWKSVYDAGIKDGTITSGTAYDTWLLSDNTRKANLYKYQDDLAKLKMQMQMTQLYQKGGKVRPVHEQIWINNEKIRAEAIKQLSKQATEFLKMALS